jgi:hypothetical protein
LAISLRDEKCIGNNVVLIAQQAIWASGDERVASGRYFRPEARRCRADCDPSVPLTEGGDPQLPGHCSSVVLARGVTFVPETAASDCLALAARRRCQHPEGN